MNLETRMRQSIRRRKASLILRSEVDSLGSRTQVTHVLDLLINKGELLRIARGVFAKATKDVANGSVRPRDELSVIVREAAQKLGLTIRNASRIESTGKQHVLVEVENPRVDRKLVVGESVVQLISHKKKCKTGSLRSVEIHSMGIAGYVHKLAHIHGVTYSENSMDKWAKEVTRLAGDEVRSDSVEDLLVALKRAGKISKRDVAQLTAGYLMERSKRVRSI